MVRVHPHLPELPIRPSAWEWLVAYGVTVEVKDPASTSGGGYWYPNERRVELFTAQVEAAIHELAHAWYEERRRNDRWRNDFLASVRRLAEETDPRYRRAARLAHIYEYGDSTTGFPGMLDNDAERYAGLASGVMGHINLLPPYVRRFYEALFDH